MFSHSATEISMVRGATNKRGVDVAPRSMRQAAWLDQAMLEARVGNTALAVAYNDASGAVLTQSKRVGDWRTGECAMQAATAFRVGNLLRKLNATTTGALALYATGHFTQYVRTLRLLAQTKAGAEAAVRLHVFGELLVEGQIALRHGWINSANHAVPQALDVARTVIRGLSNEEPDPTGTVAWRFTFETTRLYNADQLMRYIFAGAKDPHIWSSVKRSLLRATLRAWRHEVHGSRDDSDFAIADAAFDSLNDVPEHSRVQRYLFEWGQRHQCNAPGHIVEIRRGL